VDQARAAERTAALISSLDADDFQRQYRMLAPVAELGYPFKPNGAG